MMNPIKGKDYDEWGWVDESPAKNIAPFKSIGNTPPVSPTKKVKSASTRTSDSNSANRKNAQDVLTNYANNIRKLIITARSQIGALNKENEELKLQLQSSGVVKCPSCSVSFKERNHRQVPKYIKILRGKFTIELEFANNILLAEWLTLNGLDKMADGLPTLLPTKAEEDPTLDSTGSQIKKLLAQRNEEDKKKNEKAKHDKVKEDAVTMRKNREAGKRSEETKKRRGEAEKKSEGAKKRDDDSKKKTDEEVRKREDEDKGESEEATKGDEEVKRKNEEAKRKNEEAKRKNEETRRRNAEAKRRNEEAKRERESKRKHNEWEKRNEETKKLQSEFRRESLRNPRTNKDYRDKDQRSTEKRRPGTVTEKRKLSPDHQRVRRYSPEKKRMRNEPTDRMFNRGFQQLQKTREKERQSISPRNPHSLRLDKKSNQTSPTEPKEQDRSKNKEETKYSSKNDRSERRSSTMKKEHVLLASEEKPRVTEADTSEEQEEGEIVDSSNESSDEAEFKQSAPESTIVDKKDEEDRIIIESKPTTDVTDISKTNSESSQVPEELMKPSCSRTSFSLTEPNELAFCSLDESEPSCGPSGSLEPSHTSNCDNAKSKSPSGTVSLEPTFNEPLIQAMKFPDFKYSHVAESPGLRISNFDSPDYVDGQTPNHSEKGKSDTASSTPSEYYRVMGFQESPNVVHSDTAFNSSTENTLILEHDIKYHESQILAKMESHQQNELEKQHQAKSHTENQDNVHDRRESSSDYNMDTKLKNQFEEEHQADSDSQDQQCPEDYRQSPSSVYIENQPTNQKEEYQQTDSDSQDQEYVGDQSILDEVEDSSAEDAKHDRENTQETDTADQSDEEGDQSDCEDEMFGVVVSCEEDILSDNVDIASDDDDDDENNVDDCILSDNDLDPANDLENEYD